MQRHLDKRVVTRQLGRKPRPFAEVCRRCRYDYPQVITTEPVHRRHGEWEVFPTVHWLTCPLIHRAISRLEVEGQIVSYEKRLQQEGTFREAMEKEHCAAAAARMRLVPADVQRELKKERPRQWQALEGTGIAGIRSPAGVKCLHAHFADYVGRGTNPIGREVEAQLRRRGVPLDGDDDCWRHCRVACETVGHDERGS